jgi:hypothetical protein
VSVYLQVEKCVKPQLENQHSDPDFEATLLLLDEQRYISAREKEKTTEKEKQKPQLHTSEFSTNAVNSRTVPKNVTKETPSKISKKLLIEKKENKKKETVNPISQPKDSPGLTVKYEKVECQSVKNEHNRGEREKSSLPAVKRCENVSDDDDAFERKRQHRMQYQKFLQREGPKNLGGKVVPQVLDYVHTVKCSVQ